jgi:hypothetical protein
MSDYGSMLEILLRKKTKDYDVYFYENIHTTRYKSFFVDLKEWLPKEHIALYEKGISSYSCMYGSKWVGIPFSFYYNVLYSNKELLNKYNKNIPRTWNELLETSIYILDEERKLNNTEIDGYEGLFCNDEYGICSIYEFIYSSREKERVYPHLTGDISVNALKMMKKIRDKISLDPGIPSSNDLIYKKLTEEKALFVKYWDTYSSPKYEKTIIPGMKEGMSASCLGGFNLGISVYSSDEKKLAAAKVVTYMTSEETQKRLVYNYGFYSGIIKFYRDDEICKVINCRFIRMIQPLIQSSSNVKDYFDYYLKCKSLIYEFLYNIKSASEVLNQIYDMTHIYFISYKSEDSLLGLVFMIILSTILLVILLSLSFLFIRKFEFSYIFLPKSFWILLVFGCILTLSTSFTYFGRVTPTNCTLRLILLSYGTILCSVPLLYKLISNFPEENKISIWVKNHKYSFLLIFIIFDTILISILIFLSPFKVRTVSNQYGQLFQKCGIITAFQKIIVFSLFFIKVIYYLIILFLIFVEWNIETTQHDVRFLIVSVYFSIFFITLFIIIHQSRLNDYKAYFIIHDFILILFTLSNYVLLYFLRIFHFSDNKEEELMIKELINNFKESSNEEKIKKKRSQKSIGILDEIYKPKAHSNISNISLKIIQYHYNKSIKNSTSFSNTTTKTKKTNEDSDTESSGSSIGFNPID